MNEQLNNRVIRILLVDDEADLLDTLSKRLLRQGYTVKMSFSGKKAIEAAKQENFDVAVVDLKMPGMDGIETQKRLRDIQPFLQCIVLTGHGSIESAFESGREKTFQYLLKPFDYDNLVTVINEAYEKKIKLQEEKFQEQVEKLHHQGMGPRGIKKAIDDLRKIYGY